MKIKYILLSISAGLLTAASFPKIDLFFLIWIAFIPLIYIICKDDRTASSIAAPSEQRNDDNNDEDGKDTSHLEDSSHPRVKVNPTLIIKLFLAFKDFCFHKHDNETPNTGKSIFLYGLISGFVLYAASIYWLTPMLKFNTGSTFQALLSSFILWFYLALYYGVWALLLKKIHFLFSSKIVFALFASCLWVILEYIRTFLFTGFPWILTGYSQYKFIQIIQISEFTGVYGVSFLILLVNFFIYFGVFGNKKERKYLIAAAALIILFTIFGSIRFNKFKSFGDGQYSAVIIQPSVDQYKKWDSVYRNEIFRELETFAWKAYEKESDLVLWPETVIPNIIYENKNYRLAYELANTAGGFNIIGALFIDKDDYLFNAVIAFDSKDINSVQVHEKNHLVPFGEYVPFRKLLARFFGILNLMGDIDRGKDAKVFKNGELVIGSLICSENFFPDMARRFVLNGAKVLTNHTNDAWFFHTAAPYQHFIMNIFRAVENRKAVLISANSGVSGAIDASGKVVSKSDIFTDVLIETDFLQNDYKTFYTRFGDIFVLICSIIVVLLTIFAYRNKKRG